ncbi:uncharacterized protein CDAR_403401 [Caerostris darwini]|uniref:Uncharacterized protein n=1 Tax=Caerostris darwini TaxID=1538125 RepID=A0AAV4SYE8_9ARAC|nr:uncharacterized protein CDAR_403401 [Caerostris darwini]
MTRVLDALDQDITNLHQTVHDLEDRTLRAVFMQVKGYEDFRFFFLAMNLALLPVLLALAITYGLQPYFLEGAAQMALKSLVLFLIFLTSTLGLPLYLGALWAMYRFRVPEEDFMDGLFRSFMDAYQDIDDNLPNSEEISRRDSSRNPSTESLAGDLAQLIDLDSEES